MKKFIILIVSALIAGTALVAQTKRDSYEQYSFTLSCNGTTLATVNGDHVISLFNLLPSDVRDEIYKEMSRCYDNTARTAGTIDYKGVNIRSGRDGTTFSCEGYSISTNAEIATIVEVMRRHK